MSNWRASTLRVLKKPFQIGLFPGEKHDRICRWQSSNLELKSIWHCLAQRFFPEDSRLKDYQILWSDRTQYRVLGSCNLTKKRVKIARALDRPELKWALEALIYHEMCHAVVGIKRSKNGRRNQIHGKEFYALERNHPGVRELDRWIKGGGWSKVTRSYSAHRAFIRRSKIE